MAALRVLVTGAQGFVGSHLLRALQASGRDARAFEGDLLDPGSLERAFAAGPWDAVAHLAAISHVPTCEKDPGAAYRSNVTGTERLLEAMRRSAPRAGLVFASTALVYAAPERPDEASVLDESSPIGPQSAYARTKWEAEGLVARAAAQGLPAAILRLFNHTHKTQSPDFFLPHLYRAMSAASPGSELAVPVGNLDVERDLGTVQDLLRALEAVIALESPMAGRAEVYNVCSGTPRLLRELAQAMAEALGVRARFELDPARVRPGEPVALWGSHDKLTARTGWRPARLDERQFVAEFLRDL